MTGRTRKPRIFPPGSPEPGPEVSEVKGIVIVWERRADGKWHSTAPRSELAYRWPFLNFMVLTEVVSGG